MRKSVVDHPEYYNLTGKKECIEQMLEDYGPYITAIFCLTNSYKYLYRAGYKEDHDTDIEKAKWYFNFMEVRCSSAISAHGKKTMNLYLYVKKKLQNEESKKK